MNSEKTKMMISKLIANTEKLRYGSASVTVKIHDGRVVQVSYSTQEHTRDSESKKEFDKCAR
jgi:hypothetical protein